MYHILWTRYLRRYPSVIGVAVQAVLNIDLAKKRVFLCAYNAYTSLHVW